MIATRLCGLLPDVTHEESVEVHIPLSRRNIDAGRGTPNTPSDEG
jgi:hypothetical protein